MWGDTFGSGGGSAGNFGVNFVELSGLAYGVNNFHVIIHLSRRPCHQAFPCQRALIDMIK